MIKPLLHTIPALSGNVTLACNLNDYAKIGETIECHVRSARLVPLNSNISIKQCDISLLTSSYEFDLKKFYSYYPNYFYESTFSYENEDYAEYVDMSSMKYRDKDFEFGVKRVSAKYNNGNTYMFFAPFWAESQNDIPDYFLISIKLMNNAYSIEKEVKVLINDYDERYRYNYLKKYLDKYFSQVDSNVIFCNPTNKQATYYGISLLRGGFVKMMDSVIGKNYFMQSSINKFDENIVEGFRRKKLCIKQIMPISFYFDINDILTEKEQKRFKEATVYISGSWWKEGKKLPFYDFSTEYDYFTQKTWGFNDYGEFSFIDTKKNIMDAPYPSLNEARLQNYKYFNTTSKNVARWKLKYSDDENPYITNMSFAFSWLQNSLSKYKEFPSTYQVVNAYSDRNNNIVLPKKEGIFAKDSLYYRDSRSLERYRKAMLANASNWFNVIDSTEWYEKVNVNSKALFDLHKGEWYKEGDVNDINVEYVGELNRIEDKSIFTPDASLSGIRAYVKLNDEYEYNGPDVLYIKHTIFDYDEYWAKVENNKAYLNGILYDFSKIFKDKRISIDKFGVFVKPTFIKKTQSELDLIKTAKFTIMTGGKNMKKKNCFLSPAIKGMLTGTSLENTDSLFINELGFDMNTNEITHDSLFVKNTSPDSDGEFVSLTELGYDVLSLNEYYKISEIEQKFPALDINNVKKYSISGFEQLPIYRLSQISDGNDFMFSQSKKGNAKWIYESLYFNTRNNIVKTKYSKNNFTKMMKEKPFDVLEYPLFINAEFISKYDLKQFNVSTNELSKYSFSPIVVQSNEVIAENVFTKIKEKGGYNYGNTVEYHKTIDDDLDVIYVSKYNLCNVFSDVSSVILLRPIKTMFCKLINYSHLKVYISELFKNQNGQPNQGKYGNPLYKLYIKKRILNNNAHIKTIDLKDQYISVFDIYSELDTTEQTRSILNDFEEAENGCWKFSESFCKTHNVQKIMKDFNERIKDPLSYRFELVYKDSFVKLNNSIWERIHIENDTEYKDLYLYKLSKEDTYSKNLIYYYSENENTEDLYDTTLTIEPLFNNIWLQERKATIIYSEWQQSKISEVNVINDNFKLYRYDSDDVPYMYDLSDFDLENSYFSYNSTYYVSYAYLNNKNLSLNGLDQDHFKILPTYRKIENAYSKIIEASGYVPTLEYYSYAKTQNTATVVYDNISYYNSDENSRIDFETLSAITGIDYNVSQNESMYESLVQNEFETLLNNYDVHSRYIQKPIIYDSLGLYENYGVSTYTVNYVETIPESYIVEITEHVLNDDGITTTNVVRYENGVRYSYVEKQSTYGMIMIESTFDNTNTSLNLVDLYNNDKKYFTSIDNASIYNEDFNINRYFKELVPFMKSGLKESLLNSGFVSKPYILSFKNNIVAAKTYDGLYYAYWTETPVGSTTLERYFDFITPYMPKKDLITTYSLKYKDTKSTLINKKSNDDSLVYKRESTIYKYDGPRIYHSSDEFTTLDEVERKHFNDNKFINLEKEITIDLGNNLTYAELVEKEKFENVINEFSKYIRKFIKIDDNGILFLYNKYNVMYDSNVNGLMHEKTVKSYSLKLKFILK